jgi:indolepyruvate ferredoxin oxidoreductase beta subunit
MKALDFVIVGVGGQGTLLASRILGALGMNAEISVKVSEVHGMSQRGGGVITYVRFGEDVFSPLVEFGGADFVLAFEQLEALRALPYLKRDGTMIVNAQTIPPMSVITGAGDYPEGILKKLRERVNTLEVPALKMATAAGEPRAVNLVLLGVLMNAMDFSRDQWADAVRACVPEKYFAANWEAFLLGAAMSERGTSV